MALINKIREKSGIAVGIIAFGLILFMVGGDLLGPNSVIMGRNQNSVGEIAGENVSYEEYQRQIDEMEYNWTANYGRKPNETDMFTIRQQAWELMIVKKAFQKQFDKLGIKVTDKEVIDMVQGNNVSEDIKNIPMFQDENTGEFDKSKMTQFLQQLSQAPMENQAQWLAFEQSLPAGRTRLKYENLMVLSNYVTNAEAAREYSEQNSVAEIKYVYIPFYTIADSLVEVTDDLLVKYMNENKEKYKATESRSLSYVTFPVVASSQDSAAIKQELEGLKAEFASADNDSIFAAINSETQGYYLVVNPGQLPEILAGEELSAGKVFGPLVEGNSFMLYKISQLAEGDKPSARASHILFKSADESDEAKAEAKKEAEKVLNEIKAGADFAEKARQFGTDGTASVGGDLGWFNEETMVAPFSKAVFEMTSKGLINKVVETDFGYHIIKVTEAKTNLEYHIAKIDREVIPSEETRDEAYRKADMFASSVSDKESFTEKAKSENISVMDANRIAKDARRIGMLNNAREMGRWLFNEASINKVSTVFDIDNSYVVAVMTAEVEEGDLSIEISKAELTTKVKNQLKAKIIKDKLTNISGSLDEIGASYGADAKVGSSGDLKISSNSISGVGFAPAAIGTVFSMKQGEKSGVLESDNGILIIELTALTPAAEVADYSAYKTQIEERVKGRSGFNITEAIKKAANIEDERYKFF